MDEHRYQKYNLKHVLPPFSKRLINIHKMFTYIKHAHLVKSGSAADLHILLYQLKIGHLTSHKEQICLTD